MKYWHADLQFYNSVKHEYTGLYIHRQKSIYKYIIMYYYNIMSELSLEGFHNGFRSSRKSSFSLAFCNREPQFMQQVQNKFFYVRQSKAAYIEAPLFAAARSEERRVGTEC